jgi:hypothetical protein
MYIDAREIAKANNIPLAPVEVKELKKAVKA